MALGALESLVVVKVVGVLLLVLVVVVVVTALVCLVEVDFHAAVGVEDDHAAGSMGVEDHPRGRRRLLTVRWSIVAGSDWLEGASKRKQKG